MLKQVLGSVAADPRAYDAIQKAVGFELINDRVAAILDKLQPCVLVDLGAGTGLDARRRWPAMRYIAMDVDPAKLGRLRQKQPDAAIVLGDATALPLRESSADAVLIKAVTHHLDDAQLQRLLAETRRVLHAAGHVIVVDPVWNARRLPGRVLWAGDRGSHPRSAAAIAAALSGDFDIVDRVECAVLHSYVLLVAQPKVAAA